MVNISKGSNITIVSGARFRRVSEDGKSFLDQRMQEGTLLQEDTPAKVVHIVEQRSKTESKIAYVLEVQYENQTLYGWVYGYEIVPALQNA